MKNFTLVVWIVYFFGWLWSHRIFVTLENLIYHWFSSKASINGRRIFPLNDRYWCYLEYDKKKTYLGRTHTWSTHIWSANPGGESWIETHALFCINFIYRAYVCFKALFLCWFLMLRHNVWNSFEMQKRLCKNI